MHYRNEQIELLPSAVRIGDNVRIKYHGLLKNSGANEVFLYYGKDGWEHADLVQMHPESDGFYVDVKAEAHREINFCFRDSANNWDNNNGYNWKVDVYH
ncbi:MAG TPA: carbohydrate-binding protein [Bacillota bacterium]|nr:carbohydrate-binding protein [Bacillota bacterium]